MKNEMNKKYEFTGETKRLDGRIVKRIRAIRDFSDVKTGELGGWIEHESNLSHDGGAWVYDESKIYGSAVVRDDAAIFDSAKVYGNAIVCDRAFVADFSNVFDNATVGGSAMIFGNSRIHEMARVIGEARIFDHVECEGCSLITGNANILGSTTITGGAYIAHDAHVESNLDWFSVTICGRCPSLTFFRSVDFGIRAEDEFITCPIESYEEEVRLKFGDSVLVSTYLAALELARVYFKMEDSYINMKG